MNNESIINSYKKQFKKPINALAFVVYEAYSVFFDDEDFFDATNKFDDFFDFNDAFLSPNFISHDDLKKKRLYVLENINITWEEFELFLNKNNIPGCLLKEDRDALKNECKKFAKKYGMSDMKISDFSNPLIILKELDESFEDFCNFFKIDNEMIGLNKILFKFSKNIDYSFYSTYKNTMVLKRISSFSHEWMHFIDMGLIHENNSNLTEYYGFLSYKNKNLKFNNFINLSNHIKENFIKSFNELYVDLEDIKCFADIFMMKNEKISKDFLINDFFSSIFAASFTPLENKENNENVNKICLELEDYLKSNKEINDNELMNFYSEITAIYIKEKGFKYISNRHQKINKNFKEVCYNLLNEIHYNKKYEKSSLFRISVLGDKLIEGRFSNNEYLQHNTEILARTFEFYIKNKMTDTKLSSTSFFPEKEINCFYPSESDKEKTMMFWDSFLPKIINKFFIKKENTLNLNKKIMNI